MQVLAVGGFLYANIIIKDNFFQNKLAPQGILTYCASRPLPYHLYADEGEMLVLTAPMVSAGDRKIRQPSKCKFWLLAVFIC